MSATAQAALLAAEIGLANVLSYRTYSDSRAPGSAEWDSAQRALEMVRAAIANTEAAPPQAQHKASAADGYEAPVFDPQQYETDVRRMTESWARPAQPKAEAAPTQPNLACKSVQARLAKQWGYVPAPTQPVALTPDQLADKCEAWLQSGERLPSNIVDAYEAGYRDCERATQAAEGER